MVFELELESQRPWLTVLCRKLTRNRAEADDLVQHTFLRAWQGRAAFESDRSMATWLYTIAYRLHSDRKRDAGRRVRLLFVEDARLRDHPDDSPEIDSLLAFRAELETRLQALDEVATTNDRYLIRGILAGKSYAEMSREWGTTVTTVRHRVRRLYRRLACM